ncbi:NADP-dependent oxidoreductase [Dactylosporangium sp. CA-139114]|uniref:NADP-dependent oxidoreductase n=1 Tax=Dactylosporangium sp. CA-139114 TaxID=3239931 RepID=UPI003D9765C2
MQAVRFHQYGDSTVLTAEDVPTPTPGPGQVLLKVAATSFTPADAAIRAGHLRDMLPLDLPHTPGVDVAGTITALGEGVTGWTDGDTVVAFLPLNAAGAAADHVLAAADPLAPAPTTVDLPDAAALPATGLTAWQALFDHAALTAGQSILINGAGGAAGTYAVQLAHHTGAHVTAAASPASADRIRGHGADRIIDSTTTPVTKAAGIRYDVVLNLVANHLAAAAYDHSVKRIGAQFWLGLTRCTTPRSGRADPRRLAAASDAGDRALGFGP